jgi:hypothetical protein
MLRDPLLRSAPQHEGRERAHCSPHERSEMRGGACVRESRISLRSSELRLLAREIVKI